MIRVSRWRDFQHYKGRRPPWIKIHRHLLDNPEWFSLPDSAARLLPELWLIASESDGELPASNVLAFRLRRDESEIIDGLKLLVDKHFLEDASNVLAECLQSARPEERRGEKSRVEKKHLSKPQTSDAFEELWEVCRRGPKRKALEVYQRVVPAKVDHAKVLEAWRRVVASAGEPRFVPHLHRWLRDERWEEEAVRVGWPSTSRALDYEIALAEAEARDLAWLAEFKAGRVVID